MSAKVGSLCAFEMRKGVKIKESRKTFFLRISNAQRSMKLKSFFVIFKQAYKQIRTK